MLFSSLLVSDLVALADLGPCILAVLTKMIAKLRWEETPYIPVTRVRCQRSKFDDNMLIRKLKGCPPLLENNATSLR